MQEASKDFSERMIAMSEKKTIDDRIDGAVYAVCKAVSVCYNFISKRVRKKQEEAIDW